MAAAVNSSDEPTLVTGATGFIGRHVVHSLLRHGRPLRLLCRDAGKARRLFGPQLEVVEGDLLEASSVARACRGIRSVFNLAGGYEFGPAHRKWMWRVNVEGTEQLLAACWQARVERVVHCSTAGILYAAGRLVRDSDFPAKPPRACHYKQSKWHGERNALAWVGRGLPVVIASPTVPVGAGDERPTPSGRMFLDLLRGRFPACSRTGLNVIAVEDLAEGLLATERLGEKGQRYVLGHENIWLHELMALAAESAGRPAPRTIVPSPLVTFGGLLGEVWGVLMRTRNNRLCWETAYFARQRQFFDLAHTQTALDWQPRIPTRAAVANAVDWFAGYNAECQTVPEVSRGSPVSP